MTGGGEGERAETMATNEEQTTNPVTAQAVQRFRSPWLETLRRAAATLGVFREARRFSDGREALLTRHELIVFDDGRVFRGPYPESAASGLAFQCVMGVAQGTDPTREQR